jgi:hypothetical protein
MRPHHRRQPRRIDEREPAGFDSDGHRASLDRFVDVCPELLGAGDVELANNDDDETGAVLLVSTLQHVFGEGFYVFRHMPS